MIDAGKAWWPVELEGKPDFESCMRRIYAWYEGEVVDRPPVRFSSHNEEYNHIVKSGKTWNSLKDRWMDTEYQLELFERSIKGKRFLGETFPIYWPNLGPNVYASFYGCPVEFGEVTSWALPTLKSVEDFAALRLDTQCEYYQKLEEMTVCALEQCHGKYLVGYTDFHPGMDFIVAFLGTEQLCMALYDEPEGVKEITELSIRDFNQVYQHFDNLLKAQHQLSVTWMGIPSFGTMHIPSCDFSSMISSSQFEEFCLPILQQEVRGKTHKIFHMDGPGVAKHLDYILEVKEIQAIQWVQGMGKDSPILQWVPLIRKIQAAGKSVVVDLKKEELEELIANLRPEGLYLCIASDSAEEQQEILRRVEQW